MSKSYYTDMMKGENYGWKYKEVIKSQQKENFIPSKSIINVTKQVVIDILNTMCS